MSNLKRSPWYFVPTLYFMEGLPFSMVVIVASIMYKNFGVSNARITFYTGFLYLPWMIKPLWSWFIDVYKTKRWWIYTMELLIAAAFVGFAATLYTNNFFFWSLLILWGCAFFSSSHDISADGFYLLALDSSEQAFFVGIQNLFYQVARLFASGLLVFISGYLIVKTGHNLRFSWAIVIVITALITFVIGVYHKMVLPKDEIMPTLNWYEGLKLVKDVVVEFFRLDGVWITILFVMTFRIGESQVLKIVPLFILDSRKNGGLGLDNTYLGVSNMFILGAMIIAGILGGMIIYQFGLKKCIWYMVLLVNLPHFIYIYLAYALPTSKTLILSLQVMENFAITISLAAYTMITLLLVKNSRYKTAHFAFITAFRIVGTMLPSMFSGVIEEMVGYPHFFIFTVLTMLPCLLIIPLIKIDANFGKRVIS